MKPEESIAAILPVKEFRHDRYVVMATRQGVIKKVELMEFSNARRSGIMACTLRQEDVLISVQMSGGGDDIILATKDGMAIRFAEDQVRAMGRAAAGVKGIELEEGDRVVGMAVVPHGGNGGSSQEGEKVLENTMLTVCEAGYGKRTLLSEYRQQHRGGKGLIDIKTGDRNGAVIGVCVVNDESQNMLITNSGMIIRFRAKGISVIGRNTKGVRLIELGEGEKVVALAHLEEEEEQIN